MTVSVIGVVGAGFMGSGIAESAARAGKEVVLYEPLAEPLERGRSRIVASTAKALERGKLSQAEHDALIGRITFTSEFSELARVDAVIEAITEDLGLKGKVFTELDAALPNAQFIASNTSSIPIAELASYTQRPERVLGVHFFSPVPVMKLAEIVVALETSEEVALLASEFVTELEKVPIRTKDRSGFIVNMLLVPYLMAAVRMFEEGFASAEDIDLGMKLGCGHPMGPLALCDFIGLDVLYAVCDSLYEEFKQPEYAPPPLMKRMVCSGRHGVKAGRGFYDYAKA